MSSEMTQANTQTGGTAKSARQFPLDTLRGLIMVLMALDHANHFVAQGHSSGEYWGGLFPVYHDTLTFLTRFVTHLAAPGFFFLMGAGMVLFADARRQRGWSRWQVIRHFLLRGLVLVALQFVVVNRAWELSPGGWGLMVYVGVLFALGAAMMIGSLLVWLKPKYLLVLSILLLIGTELLIPDASSWNLLQYSNPMDYLNPFLIRPGGTIDLWSNYPVFPWLELLTFGMFFGYALLADREKAYRTGMLVGVAFLLVFVVVRYLDGFGNIRPREGNSWIDFLNVVKYPPSITFTLLTTGINLILLGLLSGVRVSGQRFFLPLVVYGRVPLFFYVQHLFLYVGLGWLLVPNGTTIARMLPVWLLGLLLLYPLCLWFGRCKQRYPDNLLIRLI
jgi:uncharacterized membrane protein